MLSPPAATALRLALFYIAMFGSIGIFLPYWPVWLESRGLSASQIGLVIGVSFWPRILTTLLVPLKAEQWGRRRLAMVAASSITVIGLALFALVEEFWLFILLALITGGAWAVILPIGEGISLNQTLRHGIDFGRVRLWGSIAFIVCSVLGGLWLEHAGAAIILPMVLASTALVAVAAALMPEPGTPRAASPPSLRLLLARPGLIRLMFASGLIQASHALLYGFGTIHWRAAGQSEAVAGWLWAEGVIAEVLLFLLGARLLRRVSPERLLLLAGLITVLRWTGTAFATELWLLIILQALHGASFAGTYLATMVYLRTTVPPEQQSSVQGIFAAIGYAPLFGLLSPLSGWLYGQGGGHAFLAMAGLALLGTALATGLKMPAAKSDPEAEAG
jgi:PPP family 3-phenylpropionic acid transporter